MPTAHCLEQAFEHLSSWVTAANAQIIEPSPRRAELLRDLLGATGAGGNLVWDAHLAATAMEPDAELRSNDSDFSRFQGLRWHSPFQG